MEIRLSKDRNKLVFSMFISLLITLTISAIGISIASFVDGWTISYYYGEGGMASYSIISPILRFFGVFTGIVLGGLQIVISNELAKGNSKKVNQLFTFFFLLCFLIGIILLIIGEIWAPQIAMLFGATDINSELNKGASSLIRGMFIGLPLLFLYSAILPILTFDGAKTLIKVCALINAVFDIAFDFLNGEVFHLGLFGMGLATTIGYIAAIIPLIFYLLLKKKGIKLSIKDFTCKGVGEVLRLGLPQATRRLSSTIRGIFVNFILISVGGTIALSSYGVEGNIFGILNILTTALPGIFISLTNIYKLDNDEESMKHLLTICVWYTLIFVLGISVIVCICAPYIVKIYNITDPEILKQSTLAIQIGIFGVPLCVINLIYLAYLNSIKKLKTVHAFYVVEFLINALICFPLFGYTLGTVGLWIAIPACELLSTIIIYIYSMIVEKRFSLPLLVMFPFEKDIANKDIISFNTNFKCTDKEFLKDEDKINAFLKENIKDEEVLNNSLQVFRIYKELFPIRISKVNQDNPCNIDILISINEDHVKIRIRDDNERTCASERSAYLNELVKQNPETLNINKYVKKIENNDILNIVNTVLTVN